MQVNVLALDLHVFMQDLKVSALFSVLFDQTLQTNVMAMDVE